MLESTDDDGGSHYFIAATVGELCQSLHVQTFCENDSRIEEKLFKRYARTFGLYISNVFLDFQSMTIF